MKTICTFNYLINVCYIHYNTYLRANSTRIKTFRKNIENNLKIAISSGVQEKVKEFKKNLCIHELHL